MLLTLTASCLGSLLRPGKGSRASITLQTLPGLARETLGLHGINLTTAMLAGLGQREIEDVRDCADRASCPCILLIEGEALALGDPSLGAAASERLAKVIHAAQVLGCNAAAAAIDAPDTDVAMAACAERLKRTMSRVERAEINLLISPRAGLTSTPERVTELLKKVGGFRIGTFPDFEAAAKTGSPAAYLKRLAPYASVVSASTKAFSGEEPDLKHEAYDLVAMVRAVEGVGFDGTLAVDYRGPGDAKLGVIRSRTALEAALQTGGDEP